VKQGIFTVSGQGYNAVMTSQDFATSSANPGPFLLGVVYADNDSDKFYTPGEGISGVQVRIPNGAFYAVSSTSGGYTIPVTGLSGTIQVTISGGALSASVTKSVALNGENVKLDFDTLSDFSTVFGFRDGSIRHSGNSQFDADLYGPVNLTIAIEASADLNSWEQVGTVTLAIFGGHFTDSEATPNRRFYRAVQF
jgi:hypothetical protein